MLNVLTVSSLKLLSTTLPLGVSVFTLISTTAWTLWRNQSFSKRIEAKDEQHQEVLKQVKTELNTLTVAHQEVLLQISELSKFKEKFVSNAGNTTFGPLNIRANPTQDLSKRALLKRVVEENVQLRETM